MILFSIGSVFELSRVRAIGRVVLRVTATESLLAGLLVTLGVLAIGQSWQVAILLGAVAVETAAASTLMVLRECNATGPLSEVLIGLIGLNNILPDRFLYRRGGRGVPVSYRGRVHGSSPL